MVHGDWLNPGRLRRSFQCAFRGVLLAYREEQNFRVQCLFCLGLLVLTIWLSPPLTTLVMLALACSLLLSAELFNSAIERVVDLAIGETLHPLARAAKDLSAAAVLAVSWSVGMGCMVLLYLELGDGSSSGAAVAALLGIFIQLGLRRRAI